MSEWWTYSLSDFLLFSPRTYYRLFEVYNRAIWPTQVATLVLGVVMLAFLGKGAPWRRRLVFAILAACWILVAWAYLLTRYQTINWAARYFAIGFLVEALLLAAFAAFRRDADLRPANANWASRSGLCLGAFALFGQPLIAPLVGRPWAQAEIFGVAPDPTAVATLGMVLAAGVGWSWVLLIIPLLWCAVSGATLWTMGSPEAPITPALAAIVLLFVASGAALRSQRQGPG